MVRIFRLSGTEEVDREQEFKDALKDKFIGSMLVGEKIVEVRTEDNLTADELNFLNQRGFGEESEIEDRPIDLFERKEKHDRVYWAKVDGFVAGQKPLRVKRKYRGKEITLMCYVSQRIKDLHDAGQISVGDFVTVQFVDGVPDKPLVVDKVYKTW